MPKDHYCRETRRYCCGEDCCGGSMMQERYAREGIGLRRLWVRSEETVASDDGSFEYTVYLALARFDRAGNVKYEAQVKLVPPDGKPPEDEDFPSSHRDATS